MALFSGLFVQGRQRIVVASIAMLCAVACAWWLSASGSPAEKEDSTAAIDALLGSLEEGQSPQGWPAHPELVPLPVVEPVPAGVDSRVTAALHVVNEADRAGSIEPVSFIKPASQESLQPVNQAVWFVGNIEPALTESQSPADLSTISSSGTAPTKPLIEVVPFSQSNAPSGRAP